MGEGGKDVGRRWEGGHSSEYMFIISRLAIHHVISVKAV